MSFLRQCLSYGLVFITRSENNKKSSYNLNFSLLWNSIFTHMPFQLQQTYQRLWNGAFSPIYLWNFPQYYNNQKPRKSMEEDTKPVTVQDQLKIINGVYMITEQTTLKSLRDKIDIPIQHKSQYTDFRFLAKDGGDIPLSQEQSINVTACLNDNLLKVQLIEKEKEKDSDDNKLDEKRKQSLQKTMKTKTLVEGWIRQLSDFEKQSHQDAKEKEKEAEEKLNQLKNQLDKQNIQFSLQSNANVNQIIQSLTKIVAASDEYIKGLQDAKLLSNSELSTGFSNEICVGYYSKDKQEIKAEQQIIDIDKSGIETEMNMNNLIQQQFSYQNENLEKNHTAQMERNCSGGQLSMMGGSFLFFLKGTASYDSSWSQKSQATNEDTYSSYVRSKFAAFVGNGLKFTTENIHITKNFHQSFVLLYNSYKDLKGSLPGQQFMRDAKEFVEKYGTTIQVGTYYLGNTYFNKVFCHFTKEHSLKDTQYLSSKALNISIGGGGLFQGGFFAAKGSANMTTDTGSDKIFQNLSSQMQSSKEHRSNPYIVNFQQWAEVIHSANSFWKILFKDIKKVSIFEILRNYQNRSLLQIPEKEIDQLQQILVQCQNRNFQTEQANAIKLNLDTFYDIDQQMDNLSNEEKETKKLFIYRRGKLVIRMR